MVHTFEQRPGSVRCAPHAAVTSVWCNSAEKVKQS